MTDLQASFVFGPIRKQRTTVAQRHGITNHASMLSTLHRYVATSVIETPTITIYLARGWGQIHGATRALRALLDAYGDQLRVLDEWGRPMREFTPPPIRLPVAHTSTDIQHLTRPNQDQG